MVRVHADTGGCMLTQAACPAGMLPCLQTGRCTVHCTVATMCLPTLTWGWQEVVRDQSLGWPEVNARLRQNNMM